MPDLPLDAQVWRDREGVRRAFGYTTEGQHWIHLPGVPASFRFTSSGNGVEGFAARETSVDLIEDAFRRRVVPFALQAAGEELLHASAVETARGAFAFCGASGAGKSTMADSLGSRGYRPLADDALLFDVAGGAVRVHQMPFVLRLKNDAAGNGGVLKRASIVNAGDERSIPLSGVFVLERDPGAGEPEIAPLPRHTAFSLLLYHAHCFSFSDEDRRRRMLERYLEFSAYVPVFRVRFRQVPDELPGLLDSIERVLA